MNTHQKSRPRRTSARLAMLLCWSLGCSAALAQLTAIVAVEPTARKAAHSILRTAAESGLAKASGQSVALATSDDLADVMRATRSAGFDIFIGPAQVAASALQRGYELVGATHKSDKYLLVGLAQIDAVPAMKGRRLYLPQQDSIYTYMARGMLNEAGLSFKDLRAVQYEKFPQAGLTALTLGSTDATVVREDDWAEWAAAHPGTTRVLATSQPVPGGSRWSSRRTCPPTHATGWPSGLAQRRLPPACPPSPCAPKPPSTAAWRSWACSPPPACPG